MQKTNTLALIFLILFRFENYCWVKILVVNKNASSATDRSFFGVKIALNLLWEVYGTQITYAHIEFYIFI